MPNDYLASHPYYTAQRYEPGIDRVSLVTCDGSPLDICTAVAADLNAKEMTINNVRIATVIPSEGPTFSLARSRGIFQTNRA